MAQILDNLDHQLIDMLSRDARVSNRRIAAELGVTEGTVRVRIKRLQRDGLIAFTAITGFEMSKTPRLGLITVQADIERLRAVAQTISDLPTIQAVMITVGQFNITAMALFDEVEALVELASDHILAIDGVRHVETSIAARTVKYNSRMAKIIHPHSCAEDD